jgi:hypothetical protein
VTIAKSDVQPSEPRASLLAHRHSAKEGRDIGGILQLTQNQSLIAVRREEEDNHEAEEVKEKDPAIRETSARRPRETGQVKTQTAAGRVGKSVESCEKIGRPSHCFSRKEASGANNRREETEHCQESEEKTESLTGAACSTCCRDESQVGCEASCRGE